MSNNHCLLAVVNTEKDSKEIPAECTCPICLQVFRRQVYQCRNGHVICDKCVISVGQGKCPQCRVKLKVKGSFIRNLLLEKLMDDVLVPCPFREAGCINYVRIKTTHEHAKDCTFNNKKIQLCKFLGYDCTYETNALDSRQTIDHFQTSHRAVVVEGTNVSFGIMELRQSLQNYPLADGTWPAVIVCDEYHTILMSAFYKRKRDYLSIVCIDLQPDILKPDSVGNSLKAKLLVQRDQKKMSYDVVIPSVLDAEKVVMSPEVRLAPSLSEDYADEQGIMYFNINVGMNNLSIDRVMVLEDVEASNVVDEDSENDDE